MIRALKGCRFSGENYSAGEVVPESAIEPKSIGALIKMKIIEVKSDDVQLQPAKRRRIRTRPDKV